MTLVGHLRRLRNVRLLTFKPRKSSYLTTAVADTNLPSPEGQHSQGWTMGPMRMVRPGRPTTSTGTGPHMKYEKRSLNGPAYKNVPRYRYSDVYVKLYNTNTLQPVKHVHRPVTGFKPKSCVLRCARRPIKHRQQLEIL